MLKNYLKIAFRNLWRSKTFSFINITGLALGFAACILMSLFVEYEKSFDDFHNKKEEIYRLCEVQSYPGMIEQKVSLTMYPMGPTLKKEYPQVRQFTRISAVPQLTLAHQSKRIEVKMFLWADSTFFDVFDFQWIEGNPKTCLVKPQTTVITESTALKLFGKSKVLNQTLGLMREGKLMSFKITGVIKDVPKNSHLQFEGLFSFNSVPLEDWMTIWDANWVITYLHIPAKDGGKVLQREFPKFLKKNIGEQEKYMKLFIQPLTDIHLASNQITHDDLNYQKFDKSYVNIFTILALFVLAIASFNFINLSTARSLKRAKEIGIRKVIGAYRAQLIGQFVGEAVLVTLFSAVVAMALVEIMLPFLNQSTQRPLRLDLVLHTPFILGIVAVVGVLSGLYPAFFVSAFKPVTVLKGKLQNRRKAFSLQNGLVVLQFTIAIGLIIGTVVVIQQLSYMQSKEVGFNKDHVLLIKMRTDANKNYQVLKNELLQSPLIQNITASGQRLGNNINQQGVKFKGKGELRRFSPSHLYVDENYLSFYQIKIKEGRDFKSREKESSKFFIINEALAREINEPNLVGKSFGTGWQDTLGTLIGITPDFNFNSLHHKVAPLFFSMQKDWYFSEMSVKVNPKNLSQAIKKVEDVWTKYVKDQTFQYTFLDSHFSDMYLADRQVSMVVTWLTALAIIIACLGLFGLALYTIETRTKEIGIRKVLGASVSGIVQLLASDFLKLVLIAIVIAFGLAYYFMDQWLQDFAFRIDLSWLVFVAAGLLAISSAFTTIAFQAIRAARLNPVEVLKEE